MNVGFKGLCKLGKHYNSLFLTDKGKAKILDLKKSLSNPDPI